MGSAGDETVESVYLGLSKMIGAGDCECTYVLRLHALWIVCGDEAGP